MLTCAFSVCFVLALSVLSLSAQGSMGVVMGRQPRRIQGWFSTGKFFSLYSLSY